MTPLSSPRPTRLAPLPQLTSTTYPPISGGRPGPGGVLLPGLGQWGGRSAGGDPPVRGGGGPTRGTGPPPLPRRPPPATVTGSRRAGGRARPPGR
eukprot:5378691-Alexandrium_andersonii.AAC.1